MTTSSELMNGTAETRLKLVKTTNERTAVYVELESTVMDDLLHSAAQRLAVDSANAVSPKAGLDDPGKAFAINSEGEMVMPPSGKASDIVGYRRVWKFLKELF